jgi:PAS domain S-box-containing protein
MPTDDTPRTRAGEDTTDADPKRGALEQEVAHWRARAEQAERLLEASPAYIFLYDRMQQRPVFSTAALARTLGFGLDEFLGKGSDLLPWLFHPDDLPRLSSELEANLAAAPDGAVVVFEYRLRDRSERWRWFEARCVAVERAPDGTLVQYVGAMQDITERKRMEEAMREREEALARVNAELERRVAERTAELHKKGLLLGSVIDNLPAAFFVKDTEGRYLLANRQIAELLGMDRAEVIGKRDSDLFPPEVVSKWREHELRILSEGSRMEKELLVPTSEGLRTHLAVGFPVRDELGNIIALGGIGTDITERKRAAEEREALQAQIIEAQRAAIRELSTPLIPLAQGVVVMPVVGIIDSVRAQQIMETLLSGIVSQQAQVAILDITGLQTVDTQIADALLRAARAAGLLGAEVMLTGIRPEVAQVLVQLGVDMSSIITQSTLQAGVAAALRRLHTRARGPG